MINIKRLLKGLGILNDKDQTKSLEFNVSDTATTGTKTTVSAKQTANRAITLPDADGELASATGSQDLVNKTVSLSNTSDNKLLLSQATTHKIVDSLITHIDNAGDAQLSASGAVSLTVPNTKEIILSGKAVRLPVVSFPVITPPSGNVGDIVYNSVTESLWLYQSTGYVEMLTDAGANKTLSNLTASVAVNQNINPDTSGRDLGTTSLRWDLNSDVANVNTLTVNTALTVTPSALFQNDVTINGNLSILGSIDEVSQQSLNVTDKTITVNNGGNDASAEGSGIIVKRTATNADILFDSSLTSKFKAGLVGSESEVLTAATNQTITGVKDFENILKLGISLDILSTSYLDFNNYATPVISLTGFRTEITEIRNLPQKSIGFIINNTSSNINIVHNIGISNGIYCANRHDYLLNPGEGVIYIKLENTTDVTRIFPMSQKFTEETHTFTLNGSYFDLADIFPINAIDGLHVLPYAAMITNVYLYNLKAGDGGNTRLTLSARDFGSSTYTNLFTQDPIINFSAGDDVIVGVGDTISGCISPILNVSSQFLTAKSVLKCDAVSLQTGTVIMPEDCGLIINYIKL
jgi:hypothetical protein